MIVAGHFRNWYRKVANKRVDKPISFKIPPTCLWRQHACLMDVSGTAISAPSEHQVVFCIQPTLMLTMDPQFWRRRTSIFVRSTEFSRGTKAMIMWEVTCIIGECDETLQALHSSGNVLSRLQYLVLFKLSCEIRNFLWKMFSITLKDGSHKPDSLLSIFFEMVYFGYEKNHKNMFVFFIFYLNQV